MQEIDVRYIPRFFETPSRLESRFGWNQESSSALAEEDFEKLVLIGGKDHLFDIPQIKELKKIDYLELNCSGQVLGLEGFSNISLLSLKSIPSNGIDLSIFSDLKELYFDWQKGIDEQIKKMKSLEILGLTGYKGKDISFALDKPKLSEFSCIQGALSSISGISKLKLLQFLSLGYLRNLSDIEELNKLKKLKSLHLENLPKISGVLEISLFEKLEDLSINKTKLVADLSDIKKLKSLKRIVITDLCVNLDVEQLISLKNISKISLPVSSGDLSNESRIIELAEKYDKNIEKINYVGPKKDRKLMLFFH